MNKAKVSEIIREYVKDENAINQILNKMFPPNIDVKKEIPLMPNTAKEKIALVLHDLVMTEL